jgi:hypothetical protein
MQLFQFYINIWSEGMALGKLLDKVLAKRKRFSIVGKLITNVSVLHMITMPYK